MRPGGTLAGLEFAVPENPLARVIWKGYVGWGLPLAGRLISADWAEVEASLGERHRLLARVAPRSAARSLASRGDRRRRVPPPQLRGRHRDLGSTRVTRASWYALRTGGWRDYVTLLHVPYTLWHLSYVVIGAAIAPVWLPGRLGWTLAAFALALGVGAHALDELRGRPLATRIPDGVLRGSPPSRSRWRSGSESQPRSRGGRGSRRSSRSEGSSSSRTTSSSSAGRFTPTCGSRSRGDRSRCSRPMRRPPRQSRGRLWPQPRSRRCSASPSAVFRRPYGW